LTDRETAALVVLATIETADGVTFTLWRDAADEAGISKATVALDPRDLSATGISTTRGS
jgi:hypothetical protein